MTILNTIPLLLGILTPYSLQTTAIQAFISGLILAKLTEKNKHNLAILVIAIHTSIVTSGWGIEMGLTALISNSISYILFNKISYIKIRYIPIIFSLFILNLFATVSIDGKDLLDQLGTIPQSEYMTDMTAYLKTYYLVEDNKDYYSAFANTITGRLDGAYPGEIWGWKQPLVFYFWSLFTNSGQGIAYLAAALFSITFFAIYKTISKFSNPITALMSIYMVFPYFHYPLVEMTLIQVEWWALSFTIIGIWAFMEKKYLLVGSLFAISLAIRELYAIPMMAIWSLLIFKKEFKNAIILALPIAFVFFPYFILVHVKNVIEYEGDKVLKSLSRSESSSGWYLVRTTLAYNAWSYALGKYKLFHILLVTNVTGLGLSILKNKHRQYSLILLVSFLVFFVLSFKLKMMNTWHDYWGVYYIPFLLIATPVAINHLKQFKKTILSSRT